MAIRYVDIVADDGKPPRRPDTARIGDPKLHEPEVAPRPSPSDDLPAATGKPKRSKR